ncbi:Hsp20/alpha crystallin family protein [Ruania halotolerans]|uniref:Hsp20/alpha crystallin family protein n=1 Tax=Ruania halotolerans TaxID=2897773 RepID=UPI001E3727C0|nr:Hsp20/alpha crystallin family protein [Ruania halotolerans]UFU06368.1 Hsp20/alpha crystallin family protein [Ruania halotolerans]
MTLMFDPFRDFDRRSNARGPRWMPMDLYRSGDEFVVDIDLPGVAPDSIDLDVDGNVLTVQAERVVAQPDGGRWLAQERPSGSYRRQLTLGEGLDADAISANYAHGVLTLRIPVAERAKPRKIAVQASDANAPIDSSEASRQVESA